ncbi:MAG TPA: RIO1 family regulatory kinase/ATPase [Kofleriaceae bacterium]|nr:RIO1 family regulatory kinase/ATPase [Kofleriaceae bacterium]
MTHPLDVLLADGVIDCVLGRLKSGKEADISLVQRGDHVLAAKVYKDRATRSFKNNADYKEGRKVRNSRTQRAIEGGGRFGRDAAEQAWKSAEADALYKLAGSGVRVPEPVMFYEGVLLMELVTDSDARPAPRMIDVAIERSQAMSVYADLVAQIIAMLRCDLIHGDLSPYNILAAADGPTIIDFPQVISAVHSSRAEFFFLRDFDNVLRFVSGFDPALAIHRHDGRAIWRAYVSRELTADFVPPPPPPPQARDRGPDRRRAPRFDPRGRPGGDGRPARPPDSRPSGGPPSREPSSRAWSTPSPPSRPPSPARPPSPSPSREPSPSRGWSNPSPRSAPSAAPSRGRRRRPKRHW